MGLHVKFFTDAQWAVAKAALDAAGHELKGFAASEVSKLWAETKTAFPDLVADIKQGIADYKDSSKSGGDRAVAIAEDVLKTAPDVIKALPHAKDFLVHGVAEIYADSIAELEKAAGTLLGSLTAA